MLGTASGGALVAGGAQAPSTPAAVSVRVLRAFVWGGARQEPGTILPDLDPRQVTDLVQWGKAEIVAAPDPEPATPEPEETEE